MILSSFKPLRTLTILLLSLEFLTPAFASEFSRYESPGKSYVQQIPSGNQMSPFLFLAEETDNEEILRDSQELKVTSPVPSSHIELSVSWTALEKIPGALAGTGMQFDIHPPLFALHCHFLI